MARARHFKRPGARSRRSPHVVVAQSPAHDALPICGNLEVRGPLLTTARGEAVSGPLLGHAVMYHSELLGEELVGDARNRLLGPAKSPATCGA